MASVAPPPESARQHYALSAAIALRATSEAAKAFRNNGATAAARVVRLHQVTQAQVSQRAVSRMLLEQEIDAQAEAFLTELSFTTPPDSVERMVESIDTDTEFERLVASLVQSAGRAAEVVSVAVRPGVGFVRFLSPPSCGRCAVLAGRVYRYSQGFQRHPLCDCTMIPTTVASPNFVHDPTDLARNGQVRGLSQADVKAIELGADLAQVVNVRSRKAGLVESGRVLVRSGRPTPEAIFRSTNSRAEAIAALERAGYVRT